jgi:hypothetical protein
VPVAHIGEVTRSATLSVGHGGATLLNVNLETLKEAWQKPLRW